jgi:hypothetical protein
METEKEKLRGYYFAPDYSSDFCYHAIRIRKYTLLFRLRHVSENDEQGFELKGKYYHLKLLDNRDNLPEEKIQREMKSVKAGFRSFLFLKHQFQKQVNEQKESKRINHGI